jgi:hypothetical protein
MTTITVDANEVEQMTRKLETLALAARGQHRKPRATRGA